MMKNTDLLYNMALASIVKSAGAPFNMMAGVPGAGGTPGTVGVPSSGSNYGAPSAAPKTPALGSGGDYGVSAPPAPMSSLSAGIGKAPALANTVEPGTPGQYVYGESPGRNPVTPPAFAQAAPRSY